MNGIVKRTVKQKFTPWQCSSCGKILGLIYTGGVLAVRYKDLTAWVTGQYKTVCRYCKTINTFNSGAGAIDRLIKEKKDA